MLVFVDRGKPEYPEKNPQSKARTNKKKRNPHETARMGIEPGSQRWKVERLSTAPSALASHFLQSLFRAFLFNCSSRSLLVSSVL